MYKTTQPIFWAILASQLLVSTAIAQPDYGYGDRRHYGDRYEETRRDEWRSSIRERISKAERRIERGVERGSLTHREARRLRGELSDIRYQISQMLEDDGRLSRRERARIHDRLDDLEQRIREEKRDDDRRYY